MELSHLKSIKHGIGSAVIGIFVLIYLGYSGGAIGLFTLIIVAITLLVIWYKIWRMVKDREKTKIPPPPREFWRGRVVDKEQSSEENSPVVIKIKLQNDTDMDPKKFTFDVVMRGSSSNGTIVSMDELWKVTDKHAKFIDNNIYCNEITDDAKGLVLKVHGHGRRFAEKLSFMFKI